MQYIGVNPSMRFLSTAIFAAAIGLSCTAVADADVVPPGIPVFGSPNPGGPTAVCDEAAGIGIQPIITGGSGPDSVSATPGDVVVLTNSLGGDAPSNFAAVIAYFNPADPTGTLGLSATEFETYYGGNVTSDTFADLTLSANTIFLPPAEMSGDFLFATNTVFGPGAGLNPGQTEFSFIQQSYSLMSLPPSPSPSPSRCSARVSQALPPCVAVQRKGKFKQNVSISHVIGEKLCE